MIKMKYSTYKNAAAPALALFLAGCSLMPATRGYVQQEVSGLQKKVQEQYSGLKSEVQKVKERTRAEGVASLFYGEGHDIEVGMMLARILDSYKDPKQRAIIEKIINGYGDRIGVTIVSANDENVHYGRAVVDAVGVDGKGDKRVTLGQDKTIKGIGAAKLSPQDLTQEIWKRLVESVSK